ncbi:MAG: MCE family protein [Candidatus Eisenbacteria sp.]|nr:MCE family protein [Candidatus Eisenbacteria bacterium]
MVTAAQRVRLGIFLVVAATLLAITLGVVAGGKLMERRDHYAIRYRDLSVGGLEPGADVKYSGIRVGRVDDIRIDPEDVATVIVEVSVRQGTPIKEDSEATIVTMGITGMKTIEIRGGTQTSALLSPGSEIPAGVSAFDAISGRAEIVGEKVEQVLNNLIELTGGENRNHFIDLLSNGARLVATLDTLLVRNQSSLEMSIGNLAQLTEELTETTRVIRSAVTAVDSLMNSPSFHNTFANLEDVSGDLSEADFGALAADLSEAARQANLTFTRLDLTVLKGRQDILQSLESLREGMEYFNEFARLIAENPSLILRGKKAEEIEE